MQDGADNSAATAATAPQSSVIQRTSSATPAASQPVMTNGRSTPTPSAASSSAQQPPVATPSPAGPAPLPDRSPCPSPPPVKVDTTRPFLCEWAGCLKAFRTPKEVERHAIQEHCPAQEGGADIPVPCLWARCDGMKRKRFSLMTHLQDRHCYPQVMNRGTARYLTDQFIRVKCIKLSEESRILNWKSGIGDLFVLTRDAPDRH